MIVETFPCDTCHTRVPIAELDAKPSGWWWSLSRAAARGADFDRFECRRCYGPDYASLDGSVQPVRGIRRPFVAIRAAARRAFFAYARSCEQCPTAGCSFWHRCESCWVERQW